MPVPFRNSLLTVVVVSLVAGAAGGAGSDYFVRQAGVLGNRPAPIAVLDLSAAARNLPREGEVAPLVNARIERLRAAAEKLKNAGWIVLDAQAVIGAPESLYVPLDADR